MNDVREQLAECMEGFEPDWHTPDDVRKRAKARRTRSRIGAGTVAAVIAIATTGFLVAGFTGGDPAIQGSDGTRVVLDVDRGTPSASLRYGEEVRQGIPVQVLVPGQDLEGSEPGSLITKYLGWPSAAVDLSALEGIDPDAISLPADARIESGSDDLLVLCFFKSETGTDLMTGLPVPTDLHYLDPGHYLFVVAGRGSADVPLQFAFAVDVE